MKRKSLPLIIFILGITFGYYLTKNNYFIDIFNDSYKAFQIGVYTDYETALTYSIKYNNSIIINDNELYRIYYSILKDHNNVEKMSLYLDNKKISYYIKDIKISDKKLKKTINVYEDLMNNNDVVFLEINKLILEKYKEDL